MTTQHKPGSHFTAGQRVSLDDALESFRLLGMPVLNLSPVTRRGYLYDIAELVAYLKPVGIEYVDQLDSNRVDYYLAELDSRGLKGTTRRRKVISFKSFFRYLESQKVLSPDFAAHLVFPKTHSEDPRPMTKPEYEALLRACSHHPRDHAMFELLLQTGIRLSELTSLTVESISLPSKPSPSKENGYGRLWIRRKGGNLVELILGYKTCRILNSYLKVRPESENVSLFLTKYGEPITPRSVQKALKRYVVELGMPWVHVHTLRHTNMTHHIKMGTDLKTLQHNAGHANLATTNRHVAYVKEAAIKAMQEHSL